MSAAVLAESSGFCLPCPSADESEGIEIAACPVCKHPEGTHQLLLSPAGSYVICHEQTDDGECFRVRHSLGIRFGACRRVSA